MRKTWVPVVLALCFWLSLRVLAQSTATDPDEQLSAYQQAIERRFHSWHPRASALDSTVPSEQLVKTRSVKADLVRQRAQSVSGAPRSQVSSRLKSSIVSTMGATAMPGIATRPFLQAGANPTVTTTGAFDRDGNIDFAVANAYTSDIWIYFSRGDGTFKLPRIVSLTRGLTPIGLAAADLRGNGVLDLVVGEYDTATVGVLLGNGGGTFQLEQTITLAKPPGLS